ncbi:MAG: ABC transporter permease [Alphaproteobacteria bacterium]
MAKGSWTSGLPAWLKTSGQTDAVVQQELGNWEADARILGKRMQTMTRILHALTLREVMTRFGRENLGFVWLVLEPLILTSLVMIGWTIMYGSSKHGVTIVQLVLTGYSMLTLWRHLVMRFMHCFRHNAGLLFHRNVRPMDTILARFFLETFGTLISFFVSYTVLYILDLIPPIHDVYLLLCAWFLLAGFGFAVALSVSALAELWEPSEKFIQPLMYITIPLTGAFFMVSWMPSDYHYALLLSPMINTVEMFRAGLIGPSAQTYYHPEYVLIVNVFLTAFALLLMRKAQTHIRIE